MGIRESWSGAEFFVNQKFFCFGRVIQKPSPCSGKETWSEEQNQDGGKEENQQVLWPDRMDWAAL